MLFLVSALYASNSPTTTPVAVPTPGGDPMGGSWYIHEFGPTRSNYSMGDLVRYTVTPGTVTPANPYPGFSGTNGNSLGLNIYYGMVNIPYDLDIYNYNNNTGNLYNFVGYLYAGWAALNINPAADTQSNWLTSFRKSGQGNGNGGSLDFDNNPEAAYTIQLIDYSKTNPSAYTTVASGMYDQQAATADQGQYFLGANMDNKICTYEDLMNICLKHENATLSNANASCAWNTNSDDANYVLGIETGGYAAPYGQFFGARLSHILGAVVNDVPASTNVITNMPTGTPVPQMALFTGGSATYPTYTVGGVGASIGSTAHFGTMKNYLTNISSANSTVYSGIKKLQRFSYLVNHLLPTVTRFATGGPAAAAGSTPSTTPLCSYSMAYTSDDRNLIEINSSAVTAYDNGVIVDIQNNTGDSLTVKQITSSANNVIGTLNQATNNYFLHTASLMNLPAGSTQTLPVQTNMIEIKDASISATDMPSVYISVVTAAQAAAILTPINNALGVLSPAVGTPGAADYQAAAALEYNGGSAATSSSAAQYLLITNFNPNFNSTNNVVNSNLASAYRLQAIDVSQFNGMPYFVTLQVSKENVGYGLSGGTPAVIKPGISGTSMLKCSIVSVKTCSWSNPYAVFEKQPYSQIPLLLIPDSVLNLKSQGYSLYGLQSHYGIWLMAYAAALTEFSFGCNFGDTIDCVGHTFGLFDVHNQSAPARAVIDANGVLASGQTVVLQIPKLSEQQRANKNQFAQNQRLQATAQYAALIGCDVWDGGMNQDIPILYLYQNVAGQTVANQYTAPADQINSNISYNMINFAVNFASNAPVSNTEPTTFAQGYGQPYKKTMLFSLAATTMESGIIGRLTQPTIGNYCLTFTDQSTPTPNILAFQKVFLNQATNSISINFLNSGNDQTWANSVTLPVSVVSVGVGQTASFVLTYEGAGQNNTLYAVDFTTYQAQMKSQLKVSSKLTKISTAVGLSAISSSASIPLAPLPDIQVKDKQKALMFAANHLIQQLFGNAEINAVLNLVSGQEPPYQGFALSIDGSRKFLTLDSFQKGFYIVPVFQSNSTVLNFLNNSNAHSVSECVFYFVDSVGTILGQITKPVSLGFINVQSAPKISAGSSILQYSKAQLLPKPGQPLLPPLNYNLTYPGAFFVQYNGPLPKNLQS